ncbi:ApeP family dehydratase [Chitiniphilus eburneus]|uniref:3-hydroxylacyl-ACP dehydratase n=1 Tax=Chitiniphilus eburneus TaxID=2571148 RepID=A0A4U0PQX7_9NEIS|nr:3-hydroxylacyl-ACP dehydratase [Chitiniphilus eburneus]TJZ70701.1 3-hydroxylacyl-ACP dehydratase [Chitiniphilus eburneus]
MPFTSDSPPPIAELLPHAAPMILLDRVVALTSDTIETEVVIGETSPFCEQGRVGAWVGIEYMAQSAAALVGGEARRNGQPVRVGFLVGTRDYRMQASWFLIGDTLRVFAEREFQADNGMAAMRCRIQRPDGTLLAESLLSVFQPDDVTRFLRNAG